MSDHPTFESLRRPESLPAESRKAVLDHVAGCARCREVYAGEDPTRLFALLGTRPVAKDLLEEVSAGVMAHLEEARPRGGRFFGWGGLKAAGALAAGVLLVAGLAFLSNLIPDPGPRVNNVPPEVPEVQPAQAKLMELTVGDVQLVMIFDEGLDL